MIADDEELLNAKDLQWCSKNVPDAQSSVEHTQCPADEQHSLETLRKSKVKSKHSKVRIFSYNSGLSNQRSLFHLWDFTKYRPGPSCSKAD